MSAEATGRPTRTALFIGANIAVAALFYLGLLTPALEIIHDQRDRIELQRSTLLRFRNIADKGPIVEKLIVQSREASSGGEFLSGKSEGVVNANLQARLKSVVDAAGAEFRSVRSLTARAVGAVDYTGARVEISGTVASVQKAAFDIEGSRPMLFIVSAIVRPSNPNERSGTGGQSASVEPTIEAQFDVFGAIQGRIGDE